MGEFLTNYGAILLVAVVVGGALLLSRLLLGRVETRFERLPTLLPADRADFYPALREAAAGRWAVHWSIGVGSLLQIHSQGGPRPAGSGRVLNRQVDFVLCNPETLEPVVALLLEDPAATATPDADRERITAAFASAGLPLLRIPRAESYDVETLRQSLESAVVHPADKKRGR